MTAELEMRDATAADIPAILALLAEDDLGKLRETLCGPEHLAAFRAIDTDPNQVQAVADLHREIVGCLQISFIPGLSRRGMWRGQIEAVRVSRKLRGQGIGQQMMLWAISRCQERGCGLVQLTSDSQRLAAHRFYERLGFTASHAGFKLRLEG